MTDQEKREKVIKELGNCIEYFASKVEGAMFDEWLEESRKAIALLKAQEPRVLTLEDILKLRFNDVVYFEMAISSVAIPAIVIDVIEHMPDGEIGLLQLRHIQQPTNNADLEYYGKTWRCWTSRPTDEQREATPWN